jgi:hypothetical protein
LIIYLNTNLDISLLLKKLFLKCRIMQYCGSALVFNADQDTDPNPEFFVIVDFDADPDPDPGF